jgi:hypothetical protein
LPARSQYMFHSVVKVVQVKSLQVCTRCKGGGRAQVYK